MPVRENAYYWEYSLEYPEPELAEEAYIHDQLIVEDNDYLREVNSLRELLTTYCTLSKFSGDRSSLTQEEKYTLLPFNDKPHGNSSAIYEKILKEVDRIIMGIQNIQYTEFVAYFKCLGLSHSDYRKYADEQRRIALLEKILQKYCERRRELYDRLGYTHVTQQALYDSATSRTQGSSSIQKLRQLIERVSQDSGIPIQEIKRASQFARNSSKCSFHVVRTKKNFLELKKDIGFAYKYGQKRQSKIPDLMIWINDRLLILEAKHIRESGGAQNKQIGELIDFISQKENKPVSYVAFLDGRYFNKFIGTSLSGKVQEQRDDIEKVLQKHPSNYFVNTAGLRQLLTDLLSGTTAGSDNDVVVGDDGGGACADSDHAPVDVAHLHTVADLDRAFQQNDDAADEVAGDGL